MFKEIKKIPNKELNIWLEKANSNNEKISIEYKEKIIAQFFPLVVDLINKFKFYSTQCNLEDLNQSGIMGILEAIDTFEANKGNFCGWCFYSIRKHLQRAKREEFCIRLPRNAIKETKVSYLSYNEELQMTNPSHELIVEEDKELLADMILYLSRKLPKHHAEIFSRHIFQYESTDKLTKEFGINAKQIVYQVKLKLRKRFKERRNSEK